MSDQKSKAELQNSLSGMLKLSPMVGVGDSVCGLGKLAPSNKAPIATTGNVGTTTKPIKG